MLELSLEDSNVKNTSVSKLTTRKRDYQLEHAFTKIKFLLPNPASIFGDNLESGDPQDDNLKIKISCQPEFCTMQFPIFKAVFL